MKEKLFCLLSIFAVAFAVVILVVGCPFMGLVYEENLGNGYAVSAVDVMESAAVVHKEKGRLLATVVVPQTVFAYGWNDDFILAKRHPAKKDGKVDTSLSYLYIVEMASARVDGPLSKEEFNRLRTDLKVPAELAFKTIQ